MMDALQAIHEAIAASPLRERLCSHPFTLRITEARALYTSETGHFWVHEFHLQWGTGEDLIEALIAVDCAVFPPHRDWVTPHLEAMIAQRECEVRRD